jgi:hypothetical protein
VAVALGKISRFGPDGLKNFPDPRPALPSRTALLIGSMAKEA